MSMKPRRLTPTQQNYLRAIEDRPTGSLQKGWGGYASTRTIRDLEASGYVRVRWIPRKGRADGWEARLSSKGQVWLLGHPTRLPQEVAR